MTASRSTDWTVRENVRAQLRVIINGVMERE